MVKLLSSLNAPHYLRATFLAVYSKDTLVDSHLICASAATQFNIQLIFCWIFAVAKCLLSAEQNTVCVCADVLKALSDMDTRMTSVQPSVLTVSMKCQIGTCAQRKNDRNFLEHFHISLKMRKREIDRRRIFPKWIA